jgi:hypothetical protein
METEQPYFDEKGREIKEFSVLKVYHFTGRNEQGRGRKHYYMYKWVRLKECQGMLRWVAMHLSSASENDYYQLRAVSSDTDCNRRIKGTEVVQ